MASAPKILFFDLENTAMLSYHWSRWNQNISPIQTVEESRVLCFGAKWLGGKYIFKAAYEHGREEMLTTIRDALTEADAVVSWNGVRHDTKKIKTEFLLEGMEPPAPWQEVDLMRAVKRQFSFSSNSLNHVAQQLGVGEKVKHEGFFDIIPKVVAGDVTARRKFAQYQKQDVLLLEKLYNTLLPWIPTSMHPNVGVLEELVEACPRCGSSNVQRRGFSVTSTGKFPRLQCQDCGGWSKSATRTSTTALRPL